MSRHWKTAINENEIVPDWIYHVEVCGFTFDFRDLPEVEEYLAYYQQTILPSSADGGDHSGDHWERQSCFDKLPLYLREEPKRLQVVKALERALKQWRAENDKPYPCFVSRPKNRKNQSIPKRSSA